MKSIPELFEDIISKNLNVHASLAPDYQYDTIGDYGNHFEWCIRTTRKYCNRVWHPTEYPKQS